jgi:hypothetical protein
MENGVLEMYGEDDTIRIEELVSYIHTCIHTYRPTYLHTYTNTCVFVSGYNTRK